MSHRYAGVFVLVLLMATPYHLWSVALAALGAALLTQVVNG